MLRLRHSRLMAIALSMACLAVSATHWAPQVVASQQTYIVQPHDTLSGIALSTGTTVPELMAANGLSNPDRIIAGQVLVVDPTVMTSAAVAVTSGSGYSVRAGDTLSAISQRFGVSLNALATLNNIGSPYIITIGQQLVIPAVGGGASTPAVSAVATTASSTLQTSSAAQSTYTVQAGDTLSAVSQRFGVSADALASANNLLSPFTIVTGQQLAIPAASSTSFMQASSVTSADSGTIESILTTQAEAAGVSISLIKALAWQESGWQMVTASDGGMGVMQLMPDTVTWVSTTLLGYPINPYDPTDNIRAGVAMMRYFLNLYGDVNDALAAYHQGMTSVQTQGISPETEGYIANILALQQRF